MQKHNQQSATGTRDALTDCLSLLSNSHDEKMRTILHSMIAPERPLRTHKVKPTAKD